MHIEVTVGTTDAWNGAQVILESYDPAVALAMLDEAVAKVKAAATAEAGA